MLQKGLSSLAISVALGATACAAHAGTDPVAPATFGANGYAWPPKTSSTSVPDWGPPERAAKVNPDSAPPGPAAPDAPIVVPKAPIQPVGVAKEGCIDALTAQGVEFDQVDSVRGVDTPVVVTSKIGQVRYYANGNLPLLLDCRMALTLAKIAPLLRENGVSDVRFSGAYVYRMSAKGRLSLHASGLALDVHEMTIRGQKLSVQSAFKKGLGSECTANFPALNRVACSLKSTGLFKELLTPDYNADHHDHIHLAIAPLSTET